MEQKVISKEEYHKVSIRTIVVVIVCIAILVTVGFVDIEKWLRILIIVGASLFIAIYCLWALKAELSFGKSECPHCGHKYAPTYTQGLFAPHIGFTRYMKCPKCGKKGWHKKIVD